MATNAVKNEAQGLDMTTITWEYNGEKFTFDVPTDIQDWPLEFQENFEDQNAVTAVRTVVDKDTWQKLREAKLRLRDFNDLVKTIMDGIGLGND